MRALASLPLVLALACGADFRAAMRSAAQSVEPPMDKVNETVSGGVSQVASPGPNAKRDAGPDSDPKAVSVIGMPVQALDEAVSRKPARADAGAASPAPPPASEPRQAADEGRE